AAALVGSPGLVELGAARQRAMIVDRHLLVGQVLGAGVNKADQLTGEGRDQHLLVAEPAEIKAGPRSLGIIVGHCRRQRLEEDDRLLLVETGDVGLGIVVDVSFEQIIHFSCSSSSLLTKERRPAGADRTAQGPRCWPSGQPPRERWHPKR